MIWACRRLCCPRRGTLEWECSGMDLIKAPRGTSDILPGEIYRWQQVEKTLLEEARRYGFSEVRFPTFEHTELFSRGVGETTDVVQKEMYTFEDNGGRSLTLRPEGTASVVRLLLENGLYGGALPVKLCYVINCFRYEKPQAGRYREFHQFGVEMFGAEGPAADAEIISLAAGAFKGLGIKDLALRINSIGCPDCRKRYHQALRDYFAPKAEELCETCRGRLDRNPMRILDCKSPVCGEIVKGAPVILDYICEDCASHFEGLKKELSLMGIEYEIDPGIVRGLDYYTRTVFEFVSTGIGAQGTVCGGGRYDGLVQELGGSPLSGLGFAMGLERLLLVLKTQGIELPAPEGCKLYIAPLGERAAAYAAGAVTQLRGRGIRAERDLIGRSLKAQMKYADKLGAQYVLVVGDSELDRGVGMLKDMINGGQREIELSSLADSL